MSAPREPSPFGVAVKELRVKRGWTQAILANKSGLSITALSNIESGVTMRVSAATRRAIADALNVTEEELDPIALGERVASGALSLAQRRAVLLALNSSPDAVARLFAEPDEAVAGILAALRELSADRRSRSSKRRRK